MSSVVVAVQALRDAFAARPAWIASAFAIAALAAAGAAPWFAATGAMVDHRYEPGSTLAGWDSTFRFDHRATLGAVENASRSVTSLALALALLVGAFAAGGWIELLLDRDRAWSTFWRGGARCFGRFVRVLLVTLVALQVVGWLLYDDPWKSLVMSGVFGVGELADFASERSARALQWVQDGLYLASFAAILAWADATRVRLVVGDSRSALRVGGSTLLWIARQPWRALGPQVWIVALEIALLAAIGAVASSIERGIDGAGDGVRVVALLVGGLALLALRAWLRGARYAAALARALDRTGRID